MQQVIIRVPDNYPENKIFQRIMEIESLLKDEAELFESVMLKKAEQEEYDRLKTAIRNPAFDSLKNSEEDIYTISDGKPFHDPEWEKAVPENKNYDDSSEEGLYTSDNGKKFNDKG